MSTHLLRDLQSCEDLLAVERLIRTSEGIGGRLFELLLSVIEYRDVLEWRAAVRICEALAIAGWDDRERVDARSHFNGDCWDTFFINARGEHRYRQGRWRKRKAGWVLFNPEYHHSADVPTLPSRSWEEFAGVEFAVVPAPELGSQRNYQKQMPVVMGGSGGSNEATNRIFSLARDLTKILIDEMRPNEYGEGLENLYLTLNCPGSGSTSAPGLRVGLYQPARQSFQCTLTLPTAFLQLSSQEQRNLFSDALASATDALAIRLRKKRIPFDITSFRRDLDAAIAKWNSVESSSTAKGT